MLKELKKFNPIEYKRERGKQVSYINECCVRFMQQSAMGTHPTEMGLTTKEALEISRHLKKNGVDFPTNNNEWGATPMERKVSCALGTGDVSRKAAAEALGITFEDLRRHMTNMRKRKPPYFLPEIPRGRYAPSKTNR